LKILGGDILLEKLLRAICLTKGYPDFRNSSWPLKGVFQEAAIGHFTRTKP